MRVNAVTVTHSENDAEPGDTLARFQKGTSGYLNGISSACSFSRNARTIPDMPETGSDLGFMNVAMNLVQKSAQTWLLSSGAIHAGMSLHANAGIEELKRQ